MHNEPTQQRSVVSNVYTAGAASSTRKGDFTRWVTAMLIRQALTDARLAKKRGVLHYGAGVQRIGAGQVNIDETLDFLTKGTYSRLCRKLNRRIPYREKLAELGLQEVTA